MGNENQKGKLDQMEAKVKTACAKGNEKNLKKMLKKLKEHTKTVLNRAGKHEDEGISNRTPLYLACREGHESIATYLLTLPGINGNKGVVSDSGLQKSPLHACYQKMDVDLLKKIIKSGKIDPAKTCTDHRGGRHFSLLYVLAMPPSKTEFKPLGNVQNEEKELDIVNYLLRTTKTPIKTATLGNTISIDPNLGMNHLREKRKESPLYCACTWAGVGKNDNPMVKILLDNEKTDPMIGRTHLSNKGESSETPLYAACTNKNWDAARLILKRGVDARKGNISVVEGNVNVTSPFYMLVENFEPACVEVLQLFIEKDIDPNVGKQIVGEIDVSPLYTACSQNNLKVVKGLFSLEGLDVRIGKVEGDTNTRESPLEISCRKNYRELVIMLLGRTELKVSLSYFLSIVKSNELFAVEFVKAGQVGEDVVEGGTFDQYLLRAQFLYYCGQFSRAMKDIERCLEVHSTDNIALDMQDGLENMICVDEEEQEQEQEQEEDDGGKFKFLDDEMFDFSACSKVRAAATMGGSKEVREKIQIYCGRLCPFCLTFICRKSDLFSKHTLCRKCNKLFCHMCLRVPYLDEKTGKGMWKCKGGRERCPNVPDEDFAVFPIQNKKNMKMWYKGGGK